MVAPAAHEISDKTWKNRMSDLGAAMKLVGIGKRLDHIKLKGPWEDL